MSDRYDASHSRRFWLSVAGDLDARAGPCAQPSGLGVELDRPVAALSGGERAVPRSPAILLAKADLLLLDEPTNDLDADGLECLEGFLHRFAGSIVVVSHDRAFLDRAIDRIAEVDPWTREIRAYAGRLLGFERQRERRAGARLRAHEPQPRSAAAT